MTSTSTGHEPFVIQTGREPVSRTAVARFVEAYEIDSPRFHLPAPEHGAPDPLQVPVSMLMVLAMPPYWTPGSPTMPRGAMPRFAWGQLDLPGAEMMATSIDFIFERPLRIGMHLTAAYRVVQITPKTTSVGVGSFVDFEADFTDAGSDLVARLAITVYRYDPHPTEER